jgi:hypothetical protein
MGIEPTRDPLRPHTGFEDQGHHQAPATSSVRAFHFIIEHNAPSGQWAKSPERPPCRSSPEGIRLACRVDVALASAPAVACGPAGGRDGPSGLFVLPTQRRHARSELVEYATRAVTRAGVHSPSSGVGSSAAMGVSSTVNHWSSLMTSNGPRGTLSFTQYLPSKPSGTRHEYRQTPFQPYSKSPEASSPPFSSKILIPARPSMCPPSVMP